MLPGSESGGNDSDNSTEDYVNTSIVDSAHSVHHNIYTQQKIGTCLTQRYLLIMVLFLKFAKFIECLFQILILVIHWIAQRNAPTLGIVPIFS